MSDRGSADSRSALEVVRPGPHGPAVSGEALEMGQRLGRRESA
jgi:hypothetical protein